MKVSRKSWHYKLASIKSSDYRPSDSLCVYFWQVIGGLLISMLGFGLVCGLSIFALSPLLMWVIDGFNEPGIAMTGVYIIFAVVYLMRKGYEKATESTFAQVTGAWVSAKKKRICPRIDFVSGE